MHTTKKRGGDVKPVSFALVLMLVAAGCSHPQQESASPGPASPGAASGDWPLAGYNLGNNRYVASTIDRTNVAQLAPAWTTQLADAGEQEAAPIVAAGTMYISTPHNHVLALDAATGALKW